MTAALMRPQDQSGLADWDAPESLAALAPWLTPAWAAERKYDGVRVMLRAGPARARLVTARGLDRAAAVPALAAVHGPALAGLVLDGEMVFPGGGPAARMAGWLASGPRRAADYAARYGPPSYVMFDVLALPDPDTGRAVACAALPYAARRAALEQLVPGLAAAFPGAGLELAARIPATAEAVAAGIAAGWEGVVLKRLDSPYVPGGEPGTWVKVKAAATVDVVLTGAWRAGEGGRAGTVGSAEVAVVTAAGLAPAGYVAVKPALLRRVTPAAMPALAGREVWEVRADGVSPEGVLRNPRMVRVRADKDPAGCGPGQLAGLRAVGGPPALAAAA